MTIGIEKLEGLTIEVGTTEQIWIVIIVTSLVIVFNSRKKSYKFLKGWFNKLLK